MARRPLAGTSALASARPLARLEAEASLKRERKGRQGKRPGLLSASELIMLHVRCTDVQCLPPASYTFVLRQRVALALGMSMVFRACETQLQRRI